MFFLRKAFAIASDDNKKLDKGSVFELATKPYDLSASSLLWLIKVYSHRALMEFNSHNIKLELGDSSKSKMPIGIFVFDPNSSLDSRKDFVNYTELIANRYRREITFYFTKSTSKKDNSLLSNFQIQESELPAFILFPAEERDDEADTGRYILRANNTELNESDVEMFINDFKNKKLPSFLVSEPIPEKGKEQDENGIWKLVGLTFKNFINEEAKGKHVIVNFCSDNERCNDWEERFVRVAKKLAKNKNLVFGRLDIKLNEFEGLGSDATPTVVFFPDVENIQGQKIKSGKIYDGQNMSTMSLIKFISKCYRESGQSLKIESFDDDAEENEREKFNPITPKEDEKQEPSQESESEQATNPTIQEAQEPEEKKPDASFSEIISEVKENKFSATEREDQPPEEEEDINKIKEDF